MDREAILRKSKKNMYKEEYKQVKSSGQELGTIVFACLAGIIMILDFFVGKTSYSVQCLFWGYFGSVMYAKYKTYKRTSTLIGLIASIIATVGLLLLYIMKLYNVNF